LTRTAAHERKRLTKPVLMRADISPASQVAAWGAVVVSGQFVEAGTMSLRHAIPTTAAFKGKEPTSGRMESRQPEPFGCR
jgi:hypothetical protein